MVQIYFHIHFNHIHHLAPNLHLINILDRSYPSILGYAILHYRTILFLLFLGLFFPNIAQVYHIFLPYFVVSFICFVSTDILLPYFFIISLILEIFSILNIERNTQLMFSAPLQLSFPSRVCIFVLFLPILKTVS